MSLPGMPAKMLVSNVNISTIVACTAHFEKHSVIEKMIGKVPSTPLEGKMYSLLDNGQSRDW